MAHGSLLRFSYCFQIEEDAVFSLSTNNALPYLMVSSLLVDQKQYHEWKMFPENLTTGAP
jgi:hypothetical protein